MRGRGVQFQGNLANLASRGRSGTRSALVLSSASAAPNPSTRFPVIGSSPFSLDPKLKLFLNYETLIRLFTSHSFGFRPFTLCLLVALLLSASSYRVHTPLRLSTASVYFTFQARSKSNNTIRLIPASCSQLILQSRHHAIILETVAQHGLPQSCSPSAPS